MRTTQHQNRIDGSVRCATIRLAAPRCAFGITTAPPAPHDPCWYTYFLGRQRLPRVPGLPGLLRFYITYCVYIRCRSRTLLCTFVCSSGSPFPAGTPARSHTAQHYNTVAPHLPLPFFDRAPVTATPLPIRRSWLYCPPPPFPARCGRSPIHNLFTAGSSAMPFPTGVFRPTVFLRIIVPTVPDRYGQQRDKHFRLAPVL